MYKKCPYCEKEYPEVSRYCPYCGSPNPNYKPKEDPKMDYRRQLLLFVVGFIGFQIIGTLLQFVFLLVGKANFGSDQNAILKYLYSAPVSMFVNSVTYCIVFCILLFVSKPGLSGLFKSFKNKRNYLGVIIAIAIIYSFNIFYGIILSLTGAKVVDNNNQESLESVITIYPIISLIVFGIIGPACEELTYRVGLFDLLKRKNRYLAFVLTIIIFTLIHFDFGSSTMVNELLNIPYYAAAAFAFTYVYDQYGFSASLTAHIINNMFSIIVSII